METPLDAILNLLKDGEWHTINEISTLEPLRKLSISKLTSIANCLAEYDFIELEQKETEILELSGDYFPNVVVGVKLTPPMQEFMKKILWIERSELVSKP